MTGRVWAYVGAVLGVILLATGCEPAQRPTLGPKEVPVQHLVTRKYQHPPERFCVEARTRDYTDLFTRSCVAGSDGEGMAWYRRQRVGEPLGGAS